MHIFNSVYNQIPAVKMSVRLLGHSHNGIYKCNFLFNFLEANRFLKWCNFICHTCKRESYFSQGKSVCRTICSWKCPNFSTYKDLDKSKELVFYLATVAHIGRLWWQLSMSPMVSLLFSVYLIFAWLTAKSINSMHIYISLYLSEVLWVIFRQRVTMTLCRSSIWKKLYFLKKHIGL